MIKTVKASQILKIIVEDEAYPYEYMCNTVSHALDARQRTKYFMHLLLRECFGVEDLFKFLNSNAGRGMEAYGLTISVFKTDPYTTPQMMRQHFVSWLGRRIELSGDYELCYLEAV